MMKKSLLFLALVLLSTHINAQVTLVSWSFPSGTAADSIPDGGLAMNNTFGFRSSGTSAINYSTNGVTTFCAQTTNWDNGMNTKYWSARFVSNGYNNLNVSCAIRSGGSNPGPRDFKIQYRILPDLNWTDVSGTSIVAGNNWTSGALTNVSLPALLDNQSSVIELRWVMTSNTNASGGNVAANGISKIDNIIIKGTQLVGSIQGTVAYNNVVNTPLKNVTVTLFNSGVQAGSTVTDTLGNYYFTGLAAGTYQVRCSSTSTWGGVNSADALLALKEFVALVNLSGLYLVAADVDNSAYVNSSDALKITKRFTGYTSSFTAPDWVFEKFDATVVLGSPVTQNIKGLCTGDINGSYVP